MTEESGNVHLETDRRLLNKMSNEQVHSNKIEENRSVLGMVNRHPGQLIEVVRGQQKEKDTERRKEGERRKTKERKQQIEILDELRHTKAEA